MRFAIATLSAGASWARTVTFALTVLALVERPADLLARLPRQLQPHAQPRIGPEAVTHRPELVLLDLRQPPRDACGAPLVETAHRDIHVARLRLGVLPL